MKFAVKHFVFLLLLSLVLVSCESEYSQVVKKELASGVIHEDLIFGMTMGQTQKDFYDQCWQLNRRKLINQGTGNRFAQYIMELDSTASNPEEIRMLFYGIFDEEKIMRGMHMVLNSQMWAPWAPKYQSDSLMLRLQDKYMEDYPGNPFLEIEIDDKTKAFVKVDGNRQILMYPNSNKDITVKIEDLRYSKLLN